jgi:outer membrane protein assembly factor BamB
MIVTKLRTMYKSTRCIETPCAAKYVLITVMLAAICSCSSVPRVSSLNPFATKVIPRNPPAPLAAFTPSMTIRRSWSTAVGKAGIYTFNPAVVGEHIYVAANDGTLMQLGAVNGQVGWRVNTGSKLTAGVGSDGLTIAVAGTKGMVMAFDPEGKARWTYQASSEVLSAPAVGQGLVVVRSQDNRIVGLDAQTGTRRWSVQRTAPGLALRAAPGILIAGSSAFVALPGGKLLALAVATGAPLWETAVGDPHGATELERIIDMAGMPIMSGREICAVSFQGRAMCIDAASGTVAWSKELSSESGLGADDRYIYAADYTGSLSALTRESGASVWKNTQLEHRHLSAPVVIGRAVAVGDYQGYIHFFGREEGTLLARASTDGSEIIAAPVQVGSQLIVQTRAGTVSAFSAE